MEINIDYNQSPIQLDTASHQYTISPICSEMESEVMRSGCVGGVDM